ncbi:MAG: ABC transporter permease [Burkholderiaceae bacterium]
MNSSWRRLRALIQKEFWQLWRDKSNLLLGIVLPAMLILLFGYGISMDVKNVPVAVVLEDSSPQAREVIEGFNGSAYISSVVTRNMPDAKKLFTEHQVEAIVRIPNDFTISLSRGQVHIQVIVNGVDAQRAGVINGYIQAAIGTWQAKSSDRAGGITNQTSMGQVVIDQRQWFNDANTSTWYLVPGLIVMVTTIIGAFLTALVMAREWERGTLEAIFVTPVRPVEILLAKVVPYLCVGMLGLVLCLLAARFLFHVPILGSMCIILLSSVLYLLAALGLGLLISSVTKNQFLASQVALIVSFMPALMLSGFMFDLRNVPMVIQVISQIFPATHFMQLIKSLFLAGNIWSQILKDCTILLVQSVLLLGLALRATRKQLDQ